MKPSLKHFGYRLRKVREQAGLTQPELAKKAGLTGMHISHFECGRRNPSLPNFVALIYALRNHCEGFPNYAAYLLDIENL